MWPLAFRNAWPLVKAPRSIDFSTVRTPFGPAIMKESGGPTRRGGVLGAERFGGRGADTSLVEGNRRHLSPAAIRRGGDRLLGSVRFDVRADRDRPGRACAVAPRREGDPRTARRHD